MSGLHLWTWAFERGTFSAASSAAFTHFVEYISVAVEVFSRAVSVVKPPG